MNGCVVAFSRDIRTPLLEMRTPLFEMNIVRQAIALPMVLYVGPTQETIHINCPSVYTCYRYDSVCLDGLLVKESEICHVISWPNKHAWVAPRASSRASVPVHSLISKFLRRHLSVPCAIICKVCDMSAKLCLLPLPRIC